ncbi:hypothetical protein PLICRDRAFT_70227, partial [Plicaturopsis crispa FD-325 SS-3]
ISAVKERAREWTTHTAVLLRKRADELSQSTRSTFLQLGSELNRMTGYEAIEALKRQVVEQEARITATRQAAQEAKTAYDKAVAERSNSQREVNDLLQRKSQWTDSDVGRFTTLVRQDHLYEQAEAQAKANVTHSEESVEREFSELMRAILERYHEEQIWSDKIRSASTYGSLMVLGLNMVVFVLAVVVVEPWKRKKLAATFERKVEEMGIENKAMIEGGMRQLELHFEEQGRQLAALVATREGEGVPTLRESPVEETEGLAPSIETLAVGGRLEVGAAVAAAAIGIAGTLGWFAHSWLG